ncbi:Ferredoxin-NADP reductase [Aquimarina amphilecti]|uniref:Ferredoxin-NADP reductase n=1 Tax=Aquimarina amphilecti TaxID=1038014 RepID=A0A1H7X241_AQUAM|nr:fatty acid desaturase [Aquimarina amphilecti]SEM27189.1 Ferredoxin-NADP reductase [Aquimarina amphilecti]
MKNQAVWQKYSGKVAWPTIILFSILCVGYIFLWIFYVFGLSPIWTSVIGAGIAYGMFTIAHEASHGNISGGVQSFVRLEKVLGWMSSFFLLFPFSAFVVIHLRHHAHTNDPVNDPDHYVNGSNPLSIFFRCLTLIGYYFELALGKQSRKNKAMRNIRGQSVAFSFFLIAVLSTTILLGYGSALFFVFILSALIAAPILAFSFDWLPHYPHNNLSKYHNTRIITIPGLEFLSLYQSYHLIHHLHPRVPFYKYRSCFLDMEPELFEKGSVIEGYRDQDLKLLSKQNTYSDIKSGKKWNYVLEIEDVLNETVDAVKLVFKNLDEIPFLFDAGQYVVISDLVDGNLISRCYSICEDPFTGKLAVVIKRVSGGKLSNHLVNSIKVGNKLRVSGPFGKFLLPKEINKSSVFIAGGSGITPVLSMIKFILRASKEKVTLLYGCRNEEEVIFYQELRELSKNFPKRFELLLSFEMLKADLQYEHLSKVLKDSYFYICGPSPMMEASKVALRKLGVQDSLIRTEEFSQGFNNLSGIKYQVNVEMGSDQFSFTSDRSETILEASINAKNILPHACKMGDCGTCKTLLLKGDVNWNDKEDVVLLKNEMNQGYILTCMCTPKTDITLKV